MISDVLYDYINNDELMYDMRKYFGQRDVVSLGN